MSPEPRQPLIPTPRRAHQKSRTGCRNCKLRKVKCDEKRPVCDKCSVHYANIQKCDYGDESPTGTEPMVKKPATEKIKTVLNRVVPILPKTRNEQLELQQSLLNSSLAGWDPFVQYPPTVEPEVNLLMGTFFTSHIFNIFPYYPTPTLNPVIEFFAPLITKDTVLFHVTLLVSAFRLEQHLPPKERIRCQRLSKTCMEMIQNRINEPFPICVSDETLAAVSGLAVIEHEKGNLRLSRIHVTGLKRMMEVRGGLGAVRISNPTVANVLFCMFIAAAEVELPACDAETPVQRPSWFYHSLQLDRSPYPSSSGGTSRSSSGDLLLLNPNPSVNDQYHLHLQPIDFQAHGVSPDYSELMLNIRLLAKTYQTARDCSSASEYQEVLTFLCSTLQRLLTLPVPVPGPLAGASDLGHYERAVTAACRHALVIHVFAQWCGHQPDPALLVATAQNNLLLMLRLLIDGYSGVSSKLLLWLIAVGGTCPYGPAQHKWFVGQLTDTATKLDIHSWDEMKSSLKQVIWHEFQDERQHRELWDEVVALREEEALYFSEIVFNAPDLGTHFG